MLEYYLDTRDFKHILCAGIIESCSNKIVKLSNVYHVSDYLGNTKSEYRVDTRISGDQNYPDCIDSNDDY